MERQHPPAKSVGIVDVAKHAGVSTATVSRVLNNTNYPISEEKRAVVLQAAKELGYQINQIGRALKTAHSHVIGIIIPTFQNPFFTSLITGIEQEAISRGYLPLVVSSQRIPERERQLIQHFHSNRVASLMISSVDPSPEALQQYLDSNEIICVFEAPRFGLSNHVINARTDALAAAQTATRYLLSRGHRKIAYLTPPVKWVSRMERLDGIRLEMMKEGISFTPNDVISIDDESDTDFDHYELEIGQILAQKFLKQQPQAKYTAIMANNDLIAIGIMQELQKHGVRIPEDVSVIGFDNIVECEMVTPRLTTIHLPSTELGRNSCRALIDELEASRPMESLNISMPYDLVERDSVATVIPASVP